MTPKRHGERRSHALAVAVLSLVFAAPVAAHNIYLMNDNHTDYGWNATTDEYESSMVAELDYYRGRVDATAGSPSGEQARFNADCWYYLYLYERNRPAAQFQDLINKMIDGHITVPLNPFVTLYGVLPTEAAIRGGYYPGRIERRFPGVQFLLAQEMENSTIPWGVTSLWAGSRVKYSWKGICNCVTLAPVADRTTEVFRWQGPDDQTLLMKWYQIQGGNSESWGGYAEARQIVDSLTPPTLMQNALARFSANGLPTGLFGGGWDDVSWQTEAFETAVHNWNAAHAGSDQAVLSNGVDYFQELESKSGQIPTLRGGWGNDWDLWPASLSAETAENRRGIEQLRTVETLAAIVHPHNPSVWATQQPMLEAGLVDFFKFFEHGWSSSPGGVGLDYVIANKKTWTQNFTTAVATAQTTEANAFAALLQTPDEDRFVVVNPLAFARTDFADLPVSSGGPYVVTDVATSTEVPNQVVAVGGANYLRILANNVPSLGYRIYRYVAGTPSSFPPAATITTNRIESNLYRVDLGARGQLTSAVDKDNSRELAGTGLNDFGSGTAGSPVAENVGSVSATLRMDVTGPPNRIVRVTLAQNVDRIMIEDEILPNVTANSLYRFNVNLVQPQIKFEEVGAIARPGLTAQGGDFLAGTRADFMTLNHFVSFADAGYTITLSNWDASFMQVGSSTTAAFDLPTSEVSVLAVGNLSSGSPIATQGGDTNFRHRFALRGASGAYRASQAMQMSLAHQNPLHAIGLSRNQAGPLSAASQSFLSVNVPDVLVTAFKPAEEGERGLIVRVWELDGSATPFTIDATAFAPTSAAAVSLIETDLAPAALTNGLISASIGANELQAYRFVPATLAPPSTVPPTPPTSPTATAAQPATVTATAINTAVPTIPATTLPTAALTETMSASPTNPAATPTRNIANGDLNGDGTIDHADVALMMAALFGLQTTAYADANGDGRITSADVSALIRLLVGE